MKGSLRIRVICLHPPGTEDGLFGLQDKNQQLTAGQPTGDAGALVYECEVTVKSAGGDALDYAGAFVHGTPGDRFLYLSWGTETDGVLTWIRRTKIYLASIPPELAAEAMQRGFPISATIAGIIAPRAALLDGWTLET